MTCPYCSTELTYDGHGCLSCPTCRWVPADPEADKEEREVNWHYCVAHHLMMFDHITVVFHHGKAFAQNRLGC